MSPAYTNAPVALALIEVRHPVTQHLGAAELASLKELLRGHTPLHRTEDLNEFGITIGGPFGAASPVHQRVTQVPRFIARNKRTSVTYRSDAVVVETTDYQNWTAFRELIGIALAARQDVSPVDGVERIGLRYIDEIRVPQPLPAWSEWVDASLLGPDLHQEFGLALLQQQSVMQYAGKDDGTTVTLRYGAVEGPPAVQSSPNLIRATVPDVGKYFLMDTDAAWILPDGDAIPEFSSDFVLDLADRLHTPAKAIFENLITDKLRNEVFGA